MMRSLLVAILAVAGCATAKSPTLKVLGVHDSTARHEVVFVQVTNPESRPMRLAKLDYTFAAAGETIAVGEVALDEREVPAGSAVVVEVPVDTTSRPRAGATLQGTLTAELDQIVRTFPVSAQLPAP